MCQTESPAAAPNAKPCRAQVAYLDGRITVFAAALEAQGLGPPQPVSATTQVECSTHFQSCSHQQLKESSGVSPACQQSGLPGHCCAAVNSVTSGWKS